jgi:hypothetical protein
MTRTFWMATATGLVLLAGAASAAEPPLAGCYERVYDAAHLSAHKGQLVVRATIAITPTKGFDAPIVADASLKLWVRGKGKNLDKSFDSTGACTAKGNTLTCAGSLSAAEDTTCKSKADGLRQCRVDGGDAGGFKVEGKPEGVLVSIPKRLELLQDPYDVGPYLNLSAGNAENRAFLLTKADCPASPR